ncbi:hydrolase [Actinomadura sp. CNU-125]|uniref:serine hydrolase domain-containing protein n=1 Tax=Actinomadura sp. CNU-125 TaxID=1904961 RepID=UPI000964A54A|nr:serine hydrolase domain-containing protein [Actinomadura sp. CNU-125]OLT34013.1 hydrolase [Actinomadura sp. CNU-125]
MLGAGLLQAPAAAADGLDREELRAGLDGVHEAGMYGVFSQVRDGRAEWDGAAGDADVRTGRPVRAHMRQRVGSITKTFVATAILQQFEAGRIDLDAPVGRYLPDVVPGERGERVTVRMLLNHTSGIGDYVPAAFPSFGKLSPESLDEHRFREVAPERLVRWGLEAPATNEPGERVSYSNTNYVIAGLLLEKVTGQDAVGYITRHVIRKAGLRHTSFPERPRIRGAHPKMYESLYQHIDPPRDYSVYNMSWVWTAGAVVSTMDDLNTFYRKLLTGELIGAEALAEMKDTRPWTDPAGNLIANYGLGLYSMDLPCGTFWGHDGAVFGAGTQSLSTPDGERQVSVAMNLMKYQKIENGAIVPHPIDYAMPGFLLEAACGDVPTAKSSGGSAGGLRAMPLQSLVP